MKCKLPNKSLENRRENAGAFPASQLQRSGPSKMTKVHSTLKPSTNIVMILLWGILAVITAYNSRPYSYPIVFVGLILGIFSGIMQSLAFAESREAFLNTSTLLDVRKKLKNTSI